ncbi:MAG: ABC transporter ATP-binding protein [Candidatus Lambdaproteobacteria bacterium]|nr:ABC transporter ATP-binding protein [Candidatus Lambdaproteobacteria bacterium]
MSILHLRDVSKHFGGLQALSHFDLSVPQGAIFGLIGPNGSGKTTLFNVITGFMRPSAGQIHFNEAPIHTQPAWRIAQLGLVRTFQKTSVFADLSALENIRVGCFARTRGTPLQSILRLPGERRERRAADDKARRILALLGMAAAESIQARNLPYGHQRHLEIAIALAAEPRLLLLDEPAAGLNAEETSVLMQTVQRIRDQGITVLVVEHDMKLVMGICERIAVINYGQKIAEGPPEEVSRNPDVINVYLGEDLEL